MTARPADEVAREIVASQQPSHFKEPKYWTPHEASWIAAISAALTADRLAIAERMREKCAGAGQGGARNQ